MKNLSRLVGIQSDENCDEILKFLEAELKSKVKEIKILGEQDKILVAGLNTTLNNIQPHRSLWTHRYGKTK